MTVLVVSWTEILTPQPLYQNDFILRRATVANLLTSSKFQPLLKNPSKTQKKLKKLEIKCSGAIYILISWYKKIC